MANFNFNKVVLGGRLTAEPELRTTQNGIPVASFTIAVSRRTRSQQDQQQGAAPQQPTADFFNCVAWRSTAEFVSKFFHKGSSICVVGSIQNRSWTDQQGVKRYATDIVVDEINFVDGKNDNDPPQSNQPTRHTIASADVSGFEELQSDDDLPF